VHVRPATDADVPAIVALQRRWDTHWLGAPENDESEVRESFERVDPLADQSLLLLDDGSAGDALLAFAWFWGPKESWLTVDPTVEAAPLYDVLLSWFASTDVESLEALDRDTDLQEALAGRGWTHELSSYELIRAVEGWELDEPVWPAGVEVTSLHSGDSRDVHAVIYDESGWEDVPGHGRREYEQWHGIFLGPEVVPEQQVLAWRAGRLVGVALGRTFSDGAGWVAQVAVPKDQQGQGLGRAMLLESFRRRVDAGATKIGLGVSAANPDALRLYLDLGLVVDREWKRYARP
jgi:ribosomal protein S18 acetylase RimI-like enzyme